MAEVEKPATDELGDVTITPVKPPKKIAAAEQSYAKTQTDYKQKNELGEIIVNINSIESKESFEELNVTSETGSTNTPSADNSAAELDAMFADVFNASSEKKEVSKADINLEVNSAESNASSQSKSKKSHNELDELQKTESNKEFHDSSTAINNILADISNIVNELDSEHKANSNLEVNDTGNNAAPRSILTRDDVINASMNAPASQITESEKEEAELAKMIEESLKANGDPMDALSQELDAIIAKQSQILPDHANQDTDSILEDTNFHEGKSRTSSEQLTSNIDRLDFSIEELAKEAKIPSLRNSNDNKAHNINHEQITNTENSLKQETNAKGKLPSQQKIAASLDEAKLATKLAAEPELLKKKLDVIKTNIKNYLESVPKDRLNESRKIRIEQLLDELRTGKLDKQIDILDLYIKDKKLNQHHNNLTGLSKTIKHEKTTLVKYLEELHETLNEIRSVTEKTVSTSSATEQSSIKNSGNSKKSEEKVIFNSIDSALDDLEKTIERNSHTSVQPVNENSASSRKSKILVSDDDLDAAMSSLESTGQLKDEQESNKSAIQIEDSTSIALDTLLKELDKSDNKEKTEKNVNVVQQSKSGIKEESRSNESEDNQLKKSQSQKSINLSSQNFKEDYRDDTNINLIKQSSETLTPIIDTSRNLLKKPPLNEIIEQFYWFNEHFSKLELKQLSSDSQPKDLQIVLQNFVKVFEAITDFASIKRMQTYKLALDSYEYDKSGDSFNDAQTISDEIEENFKKYFALLTNIHSAYERALSKNQEFSSSQVKEFDALKNALSSFNEMLKKPATGNLLKLLEYFDRSAQDQSVKLAEVFKEIRDNLKLALEAKAPLAATDSPAQLSSGVFSDAELNSISELFESSNSNAELAGESIVLPSISPIAATQSKEITANNRTYQFKSAKSGGSNFSGALGGVYEHKTESGETERALFKQDTKRGHIHHDKNIAEFLGSFLMRGLAPNNTNLFAQVVLANTGPATQLPDETGANIYVGSIFFQDKFRELFKDVAITNGADPDNLPDERQRFAGSVNRNAFYETMQKGNYQSFDQIMPLSLLIGDFDIHAGNVGVVEREGKKYLVRFDFAGGLKNLSDEVHPHSHLRHLPGIGPTNHFREFPRDMRLSDAMVASIDKLAELTPQALGCIVQQGLSQVEEFYGAQPIADFAKRLGMDVSTLNGYNRAGNHSEGFKELLVTVLQQYLTDKLIARQASLARFALEIKIGHLFEKVGSKWQVAAGQEQVLIDLIKANPAYFQAGEFHFRQKEHKKFFAQRKLKALLQAKVRDVLAISSEQTVSQGTSNISAATPKVGEATIAAVLPTAADFAQLALDIKGANFPEQFKAIERKLAVLEQNLNVEPVNATLQQKYTELTAAFTEKKQFFENYQTCLTNHANAIKTCKANIEAFLKDQKNPRDCLVELLRQPDNASAILARYKVTPKYQKTLQDLVVAFENYIKNATELKTIEDHGVVSSFDQKNKAIDDYSEILDAISRTSNPLNAVLVQLMLEDKISVAQLSGSRFEPEQTRYTFAWLEKFMQGEVEVFKADKAHMSTLAVTDFEKFNPHERKVAEIFRFNLGSKNSRNISEETLKIILTERQRQIQNKMADATVAKDRKVESASLFTTDSATKEASAISHALQELNKKFKSRYFDPIFYVTNPKLKKLLNVIFKKNKILDAAQMQAAWQAIKETIDDHNQLQVVRSAQQFLENYKGDKNTVSFKEVHKAFKLTQFKFENYYQHIVDLLTAYEKATNNPQPLTQNQSTELAKLEKEILIFSKALPNADNFQGFIACYAIKSEKVESRLLDAQEKIEAKLKAQQGLSSDEEIKIATIAHAPTAKAEAKPTQQQIEIITTSALPKSLSFWQKFCDDNNLICKNVEKHILQIQPKSTVNDQLNFRVDLQKNSYTYTRPALAEDKLAGQEQQLIENMVKAFIASGAKSAHIKGEQALCDRVNAALHAQNPTIEVKIEVTTPDNSTVATPPARPMLN